MTSRASAGPGLPPVRRPHLLFLSHVTPFPPDSGCTNRTLNTLRQLQLEYDITLLSFSRRNHQRDAEARAAARHALLALGFRAGEPVVVQGERSRVRRALDHLRAAIAKRPYTTFQYRSASYGAQLRDVLATRPPDVIHLDAIDLHSWLPHLPAVPVTCMHHDIESDHLRQRAATMRVNVLARHVRRQADIVARMESELCPRMALNVVCSDEDARRLAQIAPESPILVIPNGVDTTHLAPLPGVTVPERVVFVGPTYTYPNRDAVEYLLAEIWPLVRRRHPRATLHLIGGGPADVTARFATVDGVTVAGKVPDIRPHLATASCVVVPIRYGSGTRIKILDAWAMGMPIVSTSRGAAGLAARDGENLLLRDEAAAFAAAVCEVLEHQPLAARLGENGRATVVSNYSWDSIGRTLRAGFRRIEARRLSSRAS